MPIIRDIPVKLSLEDVLRRQEVRDPSRVQPRISSTTKELLGFVDGLIEPTVVYESYVLKEVQPGRLLLENGVVLENKELSTLLAPAKTIVAMICTIGPRLEEKVEMFFAQKESLKGILLDGIGSAAIDYLGLAACTRMDKDSRKKGLQASSPLSPGMGEIPLQDQRQLYSLVPAQEIGVSLTSTNMFSPRKTVSMIIGIGEKMPTWHQIEVCKTCKMRDTCTHRVKA
jgi:hypothetical protein